MPAAGLTGVRALLPLVLAVSMAAPPPPTTVQLTDLPTGAVHDVQITTQPDTNGTRGALTFTIDNTDPADTSTSVMLLVSVGDVLVTGMRVQFPDGQAREAVLVEATLDDPGTQKKFVAAPRRAVLSILGTVRSHPRSGAPQAPRTGLWLSVGPIAPGESAVISIALFFPGGNTLLVKQGTSEKRKWLPGPHVAKPVFPVAVDDFHSLMALDPAVAPGT